LGGVVETADGAQTVRFKVRLTGPPCPFFVTFGGLADSKRQAAHGGDLLVYQIYDSVVRRTTLRDLPAATGSEVLRGAFAPGEDAKELSYLVLVPPGQVRPSGSYTHPVKITLYQGTPDNFVEQDAKTVIFSIRVDPVTEMSLGEPGAVFDATAKNHRLDFGNLDKGKTRGLDLRVRSNSGYHVTMESENGGVMKHSDPLNAATIPYSLQIGGAVVSLARAKQTVFTRSNRLFNHG
jgi:hypothetical protein